MFIYNIPDLFKTYKSSICLTTIINFKKLMLIKEGLFSYMPHKYLIREILNNIIEKIKKPLTIQ